MYMYIIMIILAYAAGILIGVVWERQNQFRNWKRGFDKGYQRGIAYGEIQTPTPRCRDDMWEEEILEEDQFN